MGATEKLTAVAVRQAEPREKTYRLSDGRGLYLEVQPSGRKYWRYAYRFAGKQKTLALGVYPEVSLKAVRVAHKAARAKVAEGIDPAQVRRVEKLTRHQAAAESFEAISMEWMAARLTDKSEGHRARAERLLLRDLATLSPRPVADITAPELLAALRRIEARGAIDTAHRAKQLAGRVFAYAVGTGRAERNPAADLGREALQARQKRHRAAITDPVALGALLRAMDQSIAGPVVKTALLISPILFQRPGEIRHMEWEEINGERWEIPAEKMKMRMAHIVPLPRQVVELLNDLRPITGRGKYVFPSARGASRCMSENGVRTALRDLGYTNDQQTPHGFRATARTILDEVLGFRPDIIEQQLAHAVKDANGRAYNRTAHLKARTDMMQAWADYLDKLRLGAEVVAIGARS